MPYADQHASGGKLITIEGFPEHTGVNIDVRDPGRYGKRQLREILQHSDKLKFTVNYGRLLLVTFISRWFGNGIALF